MSMDSLSFDILIIGGGFGGLSCARELDDWLDRTNSQVSVAIVEQADRFIIGGTFQRILSGEASEDQFWRNYRDLKFKHVKFVHDRVIGFDVEGNRVLTRSQYLSFRYLVLACGAKSNPGVVPGLEDAAYSICSLEDMKQLKERLRDFNGGTIVMSVPRLPYKCPPAPYEIALIIENMVKKKGVRDLTKLVVISPDPNPVPVNNPGVYTKCLADKNVEFQGSRVLKEVDPVKKILIYESGEAVHFDILVSAFPITAPSFVQPYCEKGFIPCDLDSCRTSRENIYACGDAAHMMLGTNPPKPHPKAGGFAYNQGKCIALNLIKHFESNHTLKWSDEAPEKQRWSTTCFGDVSLDSGVEIKIDLFNPKTKPSFLVSEPDPKWHKAKINWVDEMVNQWFKN
jgi:sulfide:quinone oxidoreductase